MAIFKMTYDLVEGGLAEDVIEALGLTASFPTAPVSSSVSSLSLFAWDCPRFTLTHTPVLHERPGPLRSLLPPLDGPPIPNPQYQGFPGGSDGKESACNAGDPG